MSNKRGKTDKAELVETHNLALSFGRLTNGGGGYDDGRWKRALYHALSMDGCANRNVLEKIRLALELP